MLVKWDHASLRLGVVMTLSGTKLTDFFQFPIWLTMLAFILRVSMQRGRNYSEWLKRSRYIPRIYPSNKSHNPLGKYPTMHHFVTEMCTHVHISVTKWCIVGYLHHTLWDLCNRSTGFVCHKRHWNPRQLPRICQPRGALLLTLWSLLMSEPGQLSSGIGFVLNHNLYQCRLIVNWTHTS